MSQRFPRHPGVGAQDEDPVGEDQRFIDVVGDQQCGDTRAPLHLVEQILHAQPGQCVQRGQWLVQQQHARCARERPGKSGALCHSAGDLPGPVPGETLKPDDVEPVRHPLVALGAGGAREATRRPHCPPGCAMAADVVPGTPRHSVGRHRAPVFRRCRYARRSARRARRSASAGWTCRCRMRRGRRRPLRGRSRCRYREATVRSPNALPTPRSENPRRHRRSRRHCCNVGSRLGPDNLWAQRDFKQVVGRRRRRRSAIAANWPLRLLDERGQCEFETCRVDFAGLAAQQSVPDPCADTGRDRPGHRRRIRARTNRPSSPTPATGWRRRSGSPPAVGQPARTRPPCTESAMRRLHVALARTAGQERHHVRV